MRSKTVDYGLEWDNDCWRMTEWNYECCDIF